MFKTIISLYDRSGAMSEPWKKAGYEIIQVDSSIDNQDARLLKYQPGLSVTGIIAMPPCTYFSYARGKEPSKEELLQALSCVDAVFRLKALYKPDWWVMENPWHGSLVHYIGPPKQTIRLSDYGYQAIKKTNLWGDFKPVKPASSKIENLKGIQSLSHSSRSITPPSLGTSFFTSNN